MITRSQMFAPLLDVDPSFDERWQQFLADYSDEPDLPYYVALGSLAEHLVQRLRRGDTSGFRPVFDVVERWHVEGDSYVREAATIGLLEGIQNHGAADEVVKPADFEPWLGPESRKWWDKLNRFWEGDASALSEE